nr:O-antigen ligase family protein [uncultured Bacteroides sp.]
MFNILLICIPVLLVKKIIYNDISVNFDLLAFIISISVFFQALWGLMQYFQLLPSSFYGTCNTIWGSFDNTAGFASCLCCGLPFIMSYMKKRVLLISVCVLVIIVFLSIIVTNSRTGIVCTTLVICIFMYRSNFFNSKFKKFIVTFFFLLLLGSYYFKQDSANGRILIWRCSWEMFKDSPIYGYGIDGFQAHYMDYQADYLRKYPDCNFAMLADSVSHPFNEYVMVILNWGIIGLIVLVVLTIFLVHCYFKKPSQNSLIALISLVSIGIFSMFSYPYRYPFTWIITFLDIYILISNVYIVKKSVRIVKLVSIIFLFLCGIIVCEIQQRLSVEINWNELAYQKKDCEKLEKYKLLYLNLKDNVYFLYSYAILLYNEGLIDESLQIASRCRLYWADYSLELLIGDIYKSKYNYEMAEKFYVNASFMCPCRFTPLFSLLELYKECKNTFKVRSIAQTIVQKPVKVNSLIIMQIKYLAKCELTKNINY